MNTAAESALSPAPRPESRLRQCLGVIADGVAIVAGVVAAAAYVVTLMPRYFPEAAREKDVIGLGVGVATFLVAYAVGERCRCPGNQGPTQG